MSSPSLHARPTRFWPMGLLGLATCLLIALPQSAAAFCGFYVAKADGELFNEASKVVMMRDEDRTVITMVNDYQGEPSEFAMVIPTPDVLEREQVNVTENAIVDHLDAYSAPRVVEYFDENPCAPQVQYESAVTRQLTSAAPPRPAPAPDALGVTIEAEYTVGEYDILILSATESSGLQTWLDQNGYRTPEAARPVLGSYIKQGMKFFVARINLEEQEKLGTSFLRPLQVAFESEKFMLPIRLGTVNAKGKQDLLLFTLTRTGRVETANYRTIKVPSNVEIPLYLRDDFGSFYKSMFENAVARESGRAVFTEYAWDMSWCDPCAADPLSSQELRQLGVYWVDEDQPRRGGGTDVFVTRLHLRYDAETFPEDLRLHQTGDRDNFQGRYILRHPYVGPMDCRAGSRYLGALETRFEQEAKTLANLTGWDIGEVRAMMRENGQDIEAIRSSAGVSEKQGQKWWNDIWAD
ncbi:MAG: DUF2330 domain-containing protein [Neomegalonema sp.]|nr:DUF2330 domain-containing protein [Neomegalonema sp.]